MVIKPIVMRKSIILLLLLSFATMVFSQTKMDFTISKESVKSNERINKTKTTPVWEVTFEEATSVWTFGTNVGTKLWSVSDTTPSYGWTNEGVESPPLWVYMGYRYVHDYSESGGNFAWIDGVSDVLGLLPYEVSESYIQFDNIDLTSTLHPKLVFYQNYKDLNDSHTYIEFCVDGVTWSSIEINSNEGLNSYGDDLKEVILPVGGEGNVSIRFKWTTTSAALGGYGYGWQIDDLSIVENPDYDIELVDARMNFYEYYDYTQPDYESYFHMSSHYGKIPQQQYDSYMALSYFNIMVENRGNQEIIPTANVIVYDPDMVEIYNETVSGVEIASTLKDTIDVIDVDFALPQNPTLGVYTVTYSITIDGQIDENVTDNNFTTYFEITESEYSRSLEEPDGEAGPSDFSSGGNDGDQLGTTFLFMYETQINSVDLFIGESSDVGSSCAVNYLVYDQASSDWLVVASSSIITLEEADLGQWKNITFNDAAEVTFMDGDEWASIMISIEMIYNGFDNGVLIGYDSTLPVSIWGAQWNFIQADNQWLSIDSWKKGGLAINLNLGDAGLQCPENINVCADMEPFQIMESIPEGAYFLGTSIEDNIFYPSVAGIGEHIVTYHYYNSTCSFNINVYPLPEQKTIIKAPEDGVLYQDNYGSIEVEQSQLDIEYWTTLDGVVSLSEFIGNGGTLSLGVDYSAGTYMIWSRNEFGCEASQGVVTFIEGDGLMRIATDITYGTNELFEEDEVLVTLYKTELSELEEDVIVQDTSVFINASGRVIFELDETGTYYLGSEVNNPATNNCMPHVYYDGVLVFEEASPIEILEGEALVVNINHPSNSELDGSNNGSGTVGNQQEGKALDPEEGKVVILRNADNDEILSVCVTDNAGYYEFEGIPDNTNIQLFVSNFETPNWFAYSAQTGQNEDFEVNFIVHQDSVYPENYYNLIEINELQESLEFYPNPVSETLYLQNVDLDSEVKIFDIQGRLVLRKLLTGSQSVNIDGLESGLYIVVCETEKETKLGKFIKE